MMPSVSLPACCPDLRPRVRSLCAGSGFVRAGVLDREREPARLTAATHPLDVVLARVPYPLELFALPWCPMLTVRFLP